MKIENLKRAGQLASILNKIEDAILDAERFIEGKTRDTYGWEASGEAGLYNLYLCGFKDKSGGFVDLCGCGVGIGVVRETIKLLREQKAKIENEISEL